jgi:RNA polymerase sigma factor (sigma-70 family)
MDAQQDGVLWILEAIHSYDTRELGVFRGCHFRTFLYHVLQSRFIDVLRRQRRRQALFRLGGYMSTWLSEPFAPQRDGSSVRSVSRDPEPDRGVERDEWTARLHQELDRIGGRARELWDLLVTGMRLREIAGTLDLSYDAAKRQRRKLIAHLRTWLGGE